MNTGCGKEDLMFQRLSFVEIGGEFGEKLETLKNMAKHQYIP